MPNAEKTQLDLFAAPSPATMAAPVPPPPPSAEGLREPAAPPSAEEPTGPLSPAELRASVTELDVVLATADPDRPRPRREQAGAYFRVEAGDESTVVARKAVGFGTALGRSPAPSVPYPDRWTERDEDDRPPPSSNPRHGGTGG